LISEVNLTILDDNDLIALFKKDGQKEVIGILYKRYTRFVLSVCMKYLKNSESAKDAVMEIFESLFEKLPKHNISYFKSWLYTVSKNHCLHIIRNNKKNLPYVLNENIMGDDFMENVPFLYPDNDTTVLESKLNNLSTAINGLSKEQKICIELFYLHDKSYEEITLITNYDLKKVKSYIQNGKRNLKIKLEESDD